MKKPIVAILGRPNVGKSTLFNRIIRRREAIVDDKPGVTRDRKYAEAEWAGVEFQLVDTGGYVPDSEDVFEQAIRQQVNYAIQEADVIVFVADVTTGVTALDEEIAQILIKSGTKVLLAVNKVDNEKRETDLAEFYQLGLGDPYPVSALGGRQIGDFLDAVVGLLPLNREVKEGEEEPIHIAVLGRPNVGKSSYINAILGEEKHVVTEIPGTTRDAIDTKIKYKQRLITLIDTAGLRRKSKVKESVEFFSNVRTANALRRCDVAIILIDAAEGLTDQDKKIISLAIEAGKGIVVGVNKWDLIEKETMTARQFELEFQDQMQDLTYIPIMFVSVKNRQRVFRLLDTAVAVYEEARRTIQTAELNRFLQRAIERNHPQAYGSKWVKINYVTQVRNAPPLFVFFTNEPRGIRKNYMRYLENQLRAQFGFLGVPIRMSFRKKS